jgi:hypothetical protein
MPTPRALRLMRHFPRPDKSETEILVLSSEAMSKPLAARGEELETLMVHPAARMLQGQPHRPPGEE